MWIELVPDKVTPIQLIDVPETISVIFIQFEPASTDPFRVSPATRLAFNVPVMVCNAVLVKKSISLVPVSSEISILLIVVVGIAALAVPANNPKITSAISTVNIMFLVIFFFILLFSIKVIFRKLHETTKYTR